MFVRREVGASLLGALVVLSCSADRASVALTASAEVSASTRITELTRRFHVPLSPVPTVALAGGARAARVALPLVASEEVTVEDETSHLSVRFALEHVQDARIEVADGMALYRGALDGADVLHRVHAEGTEDFVVFDSRPAHEELTYSVDVSRVPGLRLVSNTLEFLDATGTPLLRVAPPYVVDASGQRHGAKLAVSGCAYDTSPAGPWGRTVTNPDAERCTVRVTWAGNITYPAIVDPAWVTTGSLASSRRFATASVLPSGKVLIAGGDSVSGGTSAELFDLAANGGAGTFAATGSMATGRAEHTASVLVSGKVLVSGGAYNIAATASAELYDPGTGTFTATGSMAVKRSIHTASVLPSGKVLVTGGVDPVSGDTRARSCTTLPETRGWGRSPARAPWPLPGPSTQRVSWPRAGCSSRGAATASSASPARRSSIPLAMLARAPSPPRGR